MTIVQINATCGVGSTGHICLSVSKLLDLEGVENYILYSLRNSTEDNAILFSNEYIRKFQSLGEKISGRYGAGCSFTTISLLNKLKVIQPDVVHLHNIHSRDCNFSMLFSFLKKNNIKVYWTFHDCWSFTGYCTHYDLIGCDKWMTRCGGCPQFKESSFLFDRSAYLFDRKKMAYGQGLDITIITPSQWLANQVKKSFLKEYPVVVIPNGINLEVFKPINSDIRKKLNCENKRLVLGVSFGWGYKKGLDVFNEVADKLDEDYQIVLVGVKNTDEVNDKIIKIERTNNQKELAELYSSADVFVNTSREENYPTVNMEAIACGTPVVTFNSGGSPEMIGPNCGVVIQRNDINGIVDAIKRVCSQKDIYTREACISHALTFDRNKRFQEYINLYNLR